MDLMERINKIMENLIKIYNYLKDEIFESQSDFINYFNSGNFDYRIKSVAKDANLIEGKGMAYAYKTSVSLSKDEMISKVLFSIKTMEKIEIDGVIDWPTFKDALEGIH